MRQRNGDGKVSPLLRLKGWRHPVFTFYTPFGLGVFFAHRLLEEDAHFCLGYRVCAFFAWHLTSSTSLDTFPRCPGLCGSLSAANPRDILCVPLCLFSVLISSRPIWRSAVFSVAP